MQEEVSARIGSRLDEAHEVVSVRIVPTEPFRYEPGHVVLLRTGDAPAGYFAISSAPSEDCPPTFLLKRGGRAADAILALEDGGEVWVQGPMGPGFPLADCEGSDLLFVGVGTGVAPLRSCLVEALRQRERFGRIVLVYGAMNHEHFCFTEAMEQWRTAGVEVLLVASHPEKGWSGPTGFVQEHLGTLNLDPNETIASIAGMPAMEEAVRETLSGLGFSPESVRSNY
ncbi:MAG: oxidoreductase [Myxococcota bacterium]|nr:oxidoreductase [Myxococcota bacterium]